MTPFIIIAAAVLLILTLTFAVRLHIIISYSGSLRVYLRVLAIKINIYTTAEKKKRPKKKTEKKEKKSEKSGKVSIFSSGNAPETIEMITEWLGRLFETFSRKVGVKVKRFSITVGTDDAAKTAVMYGAVNAAAETLFALLENNARFYPAKHTEINADFLSEKTSADVKIDVYINLSGIFAIINTVPRGLIKQVLSGNKSQAETK